MSSLKVLSVIQRESFFFVHFMLTFPKGNQSNNLFLQSPLFDPKQFLNIEEIKTQDEIL